MEVPVSSRPLGEAIETPGISSDSLNTLAHFFVHCLRRDFREVQLHRLELDGHCYETDGSMHNIFSHPIERFIIQDKTGDFQTLLRKVPLDTRHEEWAGKMIDLHWDTTTTSLTATQLRFAPVKGLRMYCPTEKNVTGVYCKNRMGYSFKFCKSIVEKFHFGEHFKPTMEDAVLLYLNKDEYESDLPLLKYAPENLTIKYLATRNNDEQNNVY